MEIRTGLASDSVMETPGAQRSALLSQLPIRELDLVISTAQANIYAARDPLYPVRAPEDAVHVLLRGAFFERSSLRENEGVYARPVATGEAIGLTDVLTSIIFEREIRALQPSATLRIPGATIRGLVGASGAIAAAVGRTAILQLREAELDRAVLAASDATGRVLGRLSELATRWGRPVDGAVDILLPLTQEQLGAWAGASRETTVKTLHWLRERNLIETSRRHLVIRDLEAIATLATQRGVPPPPSEPRRLQARARMPRSRRTP